MLDPTTFELVLLNHLRTPSAIGLVAGAPRRALRLTSEATKPALEYSEGRTSLEVILLLFILRLGRGRVAWGERID